MGFPNISTPTHHSRLQTPPFSPLPAPHLSQFPMNKVIAPPAPSPGIWGTLEFLWGGAQKSLSPYPLCLFLCQNWDVLLFLGFFSSTLCQADVPHSAGMFHPSRETLGPPEMNSPMPPPPLRIGGNSLRSPRVSPQNSPGGLSSCLEGAQFFWGVLLEEWIETQTPPALFLVGVWGSQGSQPPFVGFGEGRVSTIQIPPPNPWVGSRGSHITQFLG